VIVILLIFCSFIEYGNGQFACNNKPWTNNNGIISIQLAPSDCNLFDFFINPLHVDSQTRVDFTISPIPNGYNPILAPNNFSDIYVGIAIETVNNASCGIENYNTRETNNIPVCTRLGLDQQIPCTNINNEKLYCKGRTFPNNGTAGIYVEMVVWNEGMNGNTYDIQLRYQANGIGYNGYGREDPHFGSIRKEGKKQPKQIYTPSFPKEGFYNLLYDCTIRVNAHIFGKGKASYIDGIYIENVNNLAQSKNKYFHIQYDIQKNDGYPILELKNNNSGTNNEKIFLNKSTIEENFRNTGISLVYDSKKHILVVKKLLLVFIIQIIQKNNQNHHHMNIEVKELPGFTSFQMHGILGYTGREGFNSTKIEKNQFPIPGTIQDYQINGPFYFDFIFAHEVNQKCKDVICKNNYEKLLLCNNHDNELALETTTTFYPIR